MRLLFIFLFLLGLASCGDNSKNTNEEIKTVSVKDVNEKYSKLNEKEFLSLEYFNKPDKTKTETVSGNIVNTYYYKKKVVQGDDTEDWSFSFFKDSTLSTHGMEMIN